MIEVDPDLFCADGNPMLEDKDLLAEVNRFASLDRVMPSALHVRVAFAADVGAARWVSHRHRYEWSKQAMDFWESKGIVPSV